AVWDAYGTTYAYDAAGLRISATDANKHTTLYYYDADGHPTFTVNALGEVAELRYNSLNQLTARVRYGTRIATTGLVGGLDSSAVAAALQAVDVPALDSTTTYVYDERGLLWKTTDATQH